MNLSFDLKKDKPKTGNLRPKTDDVDSFILTMRFFIQDNEPSSFRDLSKIYNTCPYIKLKTAFEEYRESLNLFHSERYYLVMFMQKLLIAIKKNIPNSDPFILLIMLLLDISWNTILYQYA